MADPELTPEQLEQERKFYATHHRAQAKYRESHRAELRKKSLEYKRAHPEEAAARQAKYRAKKAEYYRTHKKQWKVYWQNRQTPEKIQRKNFLQRLKREREGQQKWRGTPAGRMSNMVSNAKQRARKYDLAFDEALRKLFTSNPPTACECCRRPLDYSVETGYRVFRAPSLDRFDNTKGYTLDNVRVLCWRCNILKNDATVEELQTIVAYMLRG